MFPQNNSLLCIEPTNNIFEDFSNNIIPSSKLLEDPYTSSSSFCLPLSPLIYNEIDHGFLSHPDLSVIQHILKVNTNPQLTPNTALSSLKENNKTGSNKDQENVNGIVEDCKKNKKGNMKGSAKSTQRKRSSKRDRHSKIKTVHGLRDRRMRLSLEVARPFFRLQDVLGFDKGSKTVEWLLLKASPFIEELIRGQEGLTVGFAKSSSTSECEVESTIDEPVATPKAKGSSDHKKSTRQKRENPKESRKEARARARMRTMAKKIIERLNFDPKLGFEAGEESGTGTLSFNNNNNNNNNEENAFGVGDEVTCWSSLAANPGNWSSLNNFSSQHSDDVLHVCQVAGIHYNGTTSWEAHSNQNQC